MMSPRPPECIHDPSIAGTTGTGVSFSNEADLVLSPCAVCKCKPDEELSVAALCSNSFHGCASSRWLWGAMAPVSITRDGAGPQVPVAVLPTTGPSHRPAVGVGVWQIV